MTILRKCVLSIGAVILGSQLAYAEEITVATVNNGDMIIMQKLSGWSGRRLMGNKVNWVVLEENVLRGAGHHRHRHQGRPVRRSDHWRLRDADLGQERLADIAQRSRRRLRL